MSDLTNETAERFLKRFGKCAWSSAIAISENFENDEDLSAFWKEVADTIRKRLQEGGSPIS